MLEVRLLGRFDVSYGGKPIVLTSRPAQSLFAYLVLNAGTAHRREKLAGMLWPDSLEATARDNLRHALWRVRKGLPPQPTNEYLLVDDMSIGFNASAEYWLDAGELERVSESATADELMPVLSSYQGELLPGFYDEWVVLEREHLQSVFEHKMARLLALLQDEGRWLEVLEWAERWIALGQKPEPAYRALMTAHAAKGDRSKVAATYERCVKSLGEFGIEPSEQTKELYENLKSGKETPGNLPVPTRHPARGAPANIPVPLTSFVGREKELNDIARLLSSSRLLTLTGPGGVGKTRLAIQTAKRSVKKFEDGVTWVGLVGLSDGNLIPQEIAQALNVHVASNVPLIETLRAYLETKDLLLVIDNCEHLIRACAEHAERLLAASPKLKILATSIEGLGIFDETIWQVPSLPLPEAQASLSLEEFRQFASIELFAERAGHTRPDFVLTDKNAKPVAQICQRLDGIPLAIELAAARIKVLSVDEIASRLDDRFSLLTAGSRTAIPRHQALRATIDWSHDLLTEPEQIMFRRLSVFAGGFTLEAAEAVCAEGALRREDILDLLGRLVDKSLVVVEADEADVGSRYRLLETIRQYALEKLAASGEAPDTRDRHLDFFLHLAEISEPNIYGNQSALWFTRLERELDNIRAAIEWATSSGKAAAALEIAGLLVYFWFAHGHLASEWNDRVQQALSRPEGQERTLARARALNGIGFMYWADIYPTDKRAELEEALSIGREFEDRWTIATALRNLGLLENIKGNYEEARSFLLESLELWRAMGPGGKMGAANSLIFLGDLALNCDDLEWARSLYEDSGTILRGPGDINFLAYLVRRLGQLAWRGGEYERPTELCRESLGLNQAVGDLRGTLACVAGFAAIAVGERRLERAARLMAALESQLGSMGIQLLFLDRREFERNLSLLRAAVDEKELAKYWAKGKAMSLDQTVALALEPS